MSEMWLIPWQHGPECLNTLPNSFENSLNQRKPKRKFQNLAKLQMVKFDQVNLMPTLSISSHQFPNLAPWYFCILGKIISRWSFWSWPIMQRPSQLILIKAQSGNVISELRSPSFGILSKSFSFCKQRALVCVIYYGRLTQFLVCQNLKINFLRPYDQAPCRQRRRLCPYCLHLVNQAQPSLTLPHPEP